MSADKSATFRNDLRLPGHQRHTGWENLLLFDTVFKSMVISLIPINMYNPKYNETMQKRMKLGDFKTYMKDGLGLLVADEKWPGARDLPLYLAKAANYRWCSCNGVSFLAAEIEGEEASLPELKRVASQVSLRAGVPVALVAQIDARQRRALVAQGIPFVVPGKQVFLPMLGFAASAGRDPAPLTKSLAPGTQAVLVALMANAALCTSEGLMRLTGMPSSSISRALDDLSRRGFVEKSKIGREVAISCKGDRNALVKSAMGCLRNPVIRTMHVRKDEQVDYLPLAGECALSERSMLASPRMKQHAVSRRSLQAYAFDEVLMGELRDSETVEIQVWAYDPLVAGGNEVDDVSLALTLVEGGDERVIGQLNALFKEELWQ